MVSGKLYDNEFSQFKITIKRISHINDIKGEGKIMMVKCQIEWEKQKEQSSKKKSFERGKQK